LKVFGGGVVAGGGIDGFLSGSIDGCKIKHLIVFKFAHSMEVEYI